ncbi:hypothetical protein, partial [Streptomyces sp. NPDC058872]|uniref:hypothetical protein n=1 Tax=Streptomyces sp. NPDC058872 TaxID=3346661 RepID=UPI00367E0451
FPVHRLWTGKRSLRELRTRWALTAPDGPDAAGVDVPSARVASSPPGAVAGTAAGGRAGGGRGHRVGPPRMAARAPSGHGGTTGR